MYAMNVHLDDIQNVLLLYSSQVYLKSEYTQTTKFLKDRS